MIYWEAGKNMDRIGPFGDNFYGKEYSSECDVRVDHSIPPVMMTPAAPDRAPRGGSVTGNASKKYLLLLCCASERP
jgi:hypothetical protein